MRSSLLMPLAASLASAVNSTMPTVTLDYCTVQASAANTTVGYYKYQNIRFAAVPTGDLRWAEPQWPPVETEINTGNLADADVDCSSTEDCLYMDIWAPANSTGKKLPVLVWTYGGGFTGGSKSENTPEGLFDLSTEFIFVAYNYRLGITGIANGITFTHTGGIANTGIYDVTQAFQWVKKYIGNFGGDPEAITAVGFSAGASHPLFQMTRFAGRAEQLFAQAYLMSPGFVPGAGHHHAEVFWQNISTAVGCPGGSVTCMREQNFTTLQDTASTLATDYTYQFQPRVDGLIIADTYESQLYQNRFNFSGPLVISHELHEANSQAWTGVNTEADITTELQVFFPAITNDAIAELLELYPDADYTSAGLRFSDMKQSLDLTAHNLAITHALNNNTWNAMVALGAATHGTDQSYIWYSTYTLSSSSSTTTTNPNTTIAVSSSSVSSNFPSSSSSATSSNSTSTTGPGGLGGSSSVNSTIAIMMQKYLLSFVLSGDPNTLWPEDKLYWPKYLNGTEDAYTQIVFNDTFTTAADDLANEKSLFWNKALWY